MPIIKFTGLANCLVALVAVGLAYLFLRIRTGAVKFIFGVLWLLFLPNTAYLFTDLAHIIYQWNNAASAFGRVLLIVNYLLLELFGIITFLFAFLPFEKIIDRVKILKNRKVTWLILFNFLVAFGVVLGRYEHINSQEVFTNPSKVLGSAIHIFVALDLLGLTILFGLLCNCVYFLFRDLLLRKTKRYFI